MFRWGVEVYCSDIRWAGGVCSQKSKHTELKTVKKFMCIWRVLDFSKKKKKKKAASLISECSLWSRVCGTFHFFQELKEVIKKKNSKLRPCPCVPVVVYMQKAKKQSVLLIKGGER